MAKFKIEDGKIYVSKQEELDALPDKFDEFVYIVIRNTNGWIYVNKARGNSSVVALENSSVVARGNSSVVARGNSSVVARGNSSVEAWGNVAVHLLSEGATIALQMFSVCWEIAKGKIKKESKNATIIKPKQSKGLTGWLETNCIKPSKKIILYKRVSQDWKTQEGTANETVWEIGKTLEHPNWEPEKEECGPGKYHACSRAFFCDEFRSNKNDRYVAIEVDKEDLHAWDKPEYPHKIAFRKGRVLHEVTKFGKKI